VWQASVSNQYAEATCVEKRLMAFEIPLMIPAMPIVSLGLCQWLPDVTAPIATVRSMSVNS